MQGVESPQDHAISTLEADAVTPFIGRYDLLLERLFVPDQEVEQGGQVSAVFGTDAGPVELENFAATEPGTLLSLALEHASGSVEGDVERFVAQVVQGFLGQLPETYQPLGQGADAVHDVVDGLEPAPFRRVLDEYVWQGIRADQAAVVPGPLQVREEPEGDVVMAQACGLDFDEHRQERYVALPGVSSQLPEGVDGGVPVLLRQAFIADVQVKVAPGFGVTHEHGTVQDSSRKVRHVHEALPAVGGDGHEVLRTRDTASGNVFPHENTRHEASSQVADGL
jgi:hypothetical protein